MLGEGYYPVARLGGLDASRAIDEVQRVRASPPSSALSSCSPPRTCSDTSGGSCRDRGVGGVEYRPVAEGAYAAPLEEGLELR
jgi:hypothetical protein